MQWVEPALKWVGLVQKWEEDLVPTCAQEHKVDQLWEEVLILKWEEPGLK